MKFKKLLISGITFISFFGSTSTVVNASPNTEIKTIKKTYAYNSKGKKKGRPYFKGWRFNIWSTKKIKGKKYYRVGKNKYIRASSVKKIVHHVYEPNYNKTPVTPWTSKHIVDTLPSLTDQIKKALSLSGEDRLEADKEIAVKLGMSPKSVTESTQSSFEQKLQSYVGSADSAKNWIEQGGR